MANRSRLGRSAALCWLLLSAILDAAWTPGWLGQVGLFTVAAVGAGVLWNAGALAAAWREDEEAKRGSSAP
ncbi:hypothetical protein [Nocardioides pocheonensis]|uniref:hypothetical protein n=1 Tax=Nocardioides pocheonensis TaxID=661485 RepID=UPI0011CDB638|nr:hypothetical protein [Nocardioides pocheonensis]